MAIPVAGRQRLTVIFGVIAPPDSSFEKHFLDNDSAYDTDGGIVGKASSRPSDRAAVSAVQALACRKNRG